MEQLQSGEVIWFGVRIRQGKLGLDLEVKAHPKIEDYFRSLSDGTTVSISGLRGQQWFSPSGGDPLIYKIPDGMLPDESDSYTLSYPGYGFSLSDEIGGNPNLPGGGGGYYNTVNLGILRLVGISRPEGIRIGVKGVLSLNGQRTLSKNLVNAVRKFVRDNINTAVLEFKLIGREVGISYTKEW